MTKSFSDPPAEVGDDVRRTGFFCFLKEMNESRDLDSYKIGFPRALNYLSQLALIKRKTVGASYSS